MATSLRETLPPRKCWADLVDSSQEGSRDETSVPPAPITDDSKSYDAPANGVDNTKDSLNTRLEVILENNKGPIDFSFLMNSHSSSRSSSSGGGLPREMPPPPVPQEAGKIKKTKGKRPLSTVSGQAQKTQKRNVNTDQERPADQQQQKALSAALPPPEASEQEWQHRIAKREKAIAVVKEFPEYLAYSTARPRDERLDSEPRTPVAQDRSLSKRRWEYEIQQWRTQLREWSKDGIASGMLADDPEEAFVSDDGF